MEQGALRKNLAHRKPHARHLSIEPKNDLYFLIINPSKKQGGKVPFKTAGGHLGSSAMAGLCTDSRVDDLGSLHRFSCIGGPLEQPTNATQSCWIYFFLRKRWFFW